MGTLLRVRADRGEEFNEFVDRVGTQEFEAQVKDLTMPIEFSLENMNYFVDGPRTPRSRSSAARGMRCLMPLDFAPELEPRPPRRCWPTPSSASIPG